MSSTDPRAEYYKEYRRRNAELLRQKDRARNAKRNLIKRKKKYHGELPKCQFCGIILAEKIGRKKHWRYCEDCKKDPGVKRHLRALYMARWYAKKVGNEQPKLVLTEDII